jgi:ABC-2 type transport system ATP-binding protein
MLTLEHVVVRYSGRTVLQDVSFGIEPGEIVAYLGANGAGKTTTMKVVTGLREPDHGRVLFRGRDMMEDPLGYRRRLGYVPETAEVYSFLSGREYLLFAGRLRQLSEGSLERRVDELLELLELGTQRDMSLDSYSKGMRQKVLIAAALLHDPELLVLDEPLSGLDVTSAMVMKALLRELASRGRAITCSLACSRPCSLRLQHPGGCSPRERGPGRAPSPRSWAPRSSAARAPGSSRAASSWSGSPSR